MFIAFHNRLDAAPMCWKGISAKISSELIDKNLSLDTPVWEHYSEMGEVGEHKLLAHILDVSTLKRDNSHQCLYASLNILTSCVQFKPRATPR